MKYQIEICYICQAESYKYNYLRKLMPEILGYTPEEVEIFIQKKCNTDYVATDLTLEEARLIAQPLKDYGIQVGLLADDLKPIFWNEVGGLQPPNPKDHYYDHPVVDRSHLWDMSKNATPVSIISTPPQPQFTQRPNKPVVICPYCGSKDTYKISGFEKAVNTGIFGIFGTKRHKQWSCRDCKSDF